MPGTPPVPPSQPPSDPFRDLFARAAGSRLLPADRRTALRPAPTTSRWWRALVLSRGWLNRHRRRWLGPALVCAPPVGVAMLWAGASRPGQHRSWVTVGAAAWTLVLLLAVVLVAVPGAQPAEAGSVPSLAGGPALRAAASHAAVAPVARAAVASSAAGVRATPVGAAGLGGASVDVAPDEPAAAEPPPTPRPPVVSTPRAATASAAAPAAEPPRPTAAPMPRRTPGPTRTATPAPSAVTTADPLTSCPTEGATAVSPHGWSLRCSRTPIGLFWLHAR